MDAIGIVLAFLAFCAALGLGFGIVGLVYNAAFGYPLFIFGIVFFVLVALLTALMGKK
jgi:hypothetical protein